MARMLGDDDSGEISEYALILSVILMLGIALISQTGATLKRVYQRVYLAWPPQSRSPTTTPMSSLAIAPGTSRDGTIQQLRPRDARHLFSKDRSRSEQV